jgi:hypothetical protein
MSPDGTRLAGTSADGTLTLLAIAAKRPAPAPERLSFAERMREVRFSSDGKKLLLIGEHRWLVRGIASGRELAGATQAGPVSATFVDGGAQVFHGTLQAGESVATWRNRLADDDPMKRQP